MCQVLIFAVKKALKEMISNKDIVRHNVIVINQVINA
jgi:hypothetical protein